MTCEFSVRFCPQDSILCSVMKRDQIAIVTNRSAGVTVKGSVESIILRQQGTQAKESSLVLKPMT